MVGVKNAATSRNVVFKSVCFSTPKQCLRCCDITYAESIRLALVELTSLTSSTLYYLWLIEIECVEQVICMKTSQMSC